MSIQNLPATDPSHYCEVIALLCVVFGVLPGTSQLILLRDHNFKLGKRTSGATVERVKYRIDLTHLRPGFVS